MSEILNENIGSVYSYDRYSNVYFFKQIAIEICKNTQNIFLLIFSNDYFSSVLYII